MKRLRHPVRAIREPFGTAGLILAMVALVAALGGSALAAKGALTGKQKKEVEKIAKKYAGKPGANGTNGTDGTNGANGAKGDAGAPGATGPVGPQGVQGPQGLAGATGEAGMCSEEEPECVLPGEATLTGMWSASAGASEATLATISFPLRVSPAPTALYPVRFGPFTASRKLEDGASSLYGWTGPDDVEAGQAAWEAACPGSFEAPQATPGFLCIYPNLELLGNGGFLETPAAIEPSLVEAAHEFGIDLPFKYAGGGTGAVAESAILRGSWAVVG